MERKKNKQKGQGLSYGLLVFFLLAMAVSSLLPLRQKPYAHYVPQEGVELQGALLLPSKDFQGQILFPASVSYQGNLQAGLFDGPASLHFPEGLVLEGTFSEGKLIGGTISLPQAGSYQRQADGTWEKLDPGEQEEPKEQETKEGAD